MYLRILTVVLCLAGLGVASLPADAAKDLLKRDFSKEFEELTPSEQIAIRAAAKAAYKAKKLQTKYIGTFRKSPSTMLSMSERRTLLR